MRQTLIWDWNGTLLDDVDVCIAAINRLLTPRGLEQMNLERYYRIFTFPVRRYYEAMGFDLRREEFAEIAVEYHDAYEAVVGTAALRLDTVSALELASEAGVRQVVLSALEESRLHRELERRGIAHHFEAAYGLGDLHAASKEARGYELVADLGLAAGSAWMVGDTDHDIDVARRLGVRPVAVTGGHHSRERLAGTGAPVAGSLLEALACVGL